MIQEEYLKMYEDFLNYEKHVTLMVRSYRNDTVNKTNV